MVWRSSSPIFVLESSSVWSVNTNGKNGVILRLDLYLKGKYVKKKVEFWFFKHVCKLSVNDISCLA